MNKFECKYSMYLHRPGVKSVVTGENIIDAIKNSNKNAILVWIEDEDGTEYVVREHDYPDANGYFNYFWVNPTTEEILYDENNKEDNEVKTVFVVSSDITKTTTGSGWVSPEGLFYECEYEGHSNLAQYMLEDGIVTEGTSEEMGWNRYNMEAVLEARKWAKLSNGEIYYKTNFESAAPNLNKRQKETLIDYFLSKGKNYIIKFGMKQSIEKFLNEDY